MKKISKIKLNQFSTDELDRRKMNALKGGCECASCSCRCATTDEMAWSNASHMSRLSHGGSFSY